MIKKRVFIGFLLGLLINAIGLIISTLLFGESSDVLQSLRQARANEFFGKLVSLGAVLNLFLFFYFIKKKQDYKARGVILATVFVTILTFLINYF